MVHGMTKTKKTYAATCIPHLTRRSLLDSAAKRECGAATISLCNRMNKTTLTSADKPKKPAVLESLKPMARNTGVKTMGAAMLAAYVIYIALIF